MTSILSVLLSDVLPRVATITLLIGIGVSLANLAVAYGVVDVVGRAGRYLTEPANLPDEVGTAVLTNAVSVTAGYGMLAEFRESGVLDDRATLIAIVVNTFFGFVQHIFTYYGPVLIPILGLSAGLMYVGARAGISLAITLVGLAAGALLLRGVEYETRSGDGDAPEGIDESDRTSTEPLREAAEKTVERLRSIVPRLAVVYSVVFLALEYTDLKAVTGVAEPVTSLIGLPGAAVPIVAVSLVDPTSGAIAIAPMIGDVFTPREAVVTLLIGSLFSLTVGTVKRSIPFQYGIWGPAFGTKVIVVNTGLKAIFIVAAIGVFLVV
ncbi:nucleoside recognition protein [Natrarchaeobius chitinivorans]|uniref:Nucleoside recognition protein n=1 Tax=Natrarchaeobius chitinivorans TaxID=1679083 RepID=A0A3N6LQD1_NATCH|nr:nucleoside recognition protein [Natrarchaeobius chitinivorans]RQG90457.1 nucleoside recognition protein [Natrarchaeobius chitinivorans]